MSQFTRIFYRSTLRTPPLRTYWKFKQDRVTWREDHERYRFVEYLSRTYSLVVKILVHENFEIDESTDAIEGRIFCDILVVIISHF